MITLHGDPDVLLPKATDSDVYGRMVRESGRGPLHRFYTIQGGTHVDGLYDSFPDRLRPILPCYRAGFDARTAWVDRRERPPADRTVGRPTGGDVVDSCALAGQAADRQDLSGRVPCVSHGAACAAGRGPG